MSVSGNVYLIITKSNTLVRKIKEKRKKSEQEKYSMATIILEEVGSVQAICRSLEHVVQYE